MVPHSDIPVDWRTVDKLCWNRRLIWSYSYQDHMVMKRQDEKFRKDIVKVFSAACFIELFDRSVDSDLRW